MSTGNWTSKLGINPTEEIRKNATHTTIQNLKKNLLKCREELIKCRANNNNLKNQIEMLTAEDYENGGGRRKRRTKRRKSSKKRTKKRTKKRRRRLSRNK